MDSMQADIHPAVAAIVAKWSVAFKRLDADALSALYSRHALFYGSTPILYRGLDGVAAYFNALRRWPSPTVTFAGLVTMAVGDDLINMAGRATFLVTEDAAPLEVKITWLIVREDGDWKIVSHHVSPIAPLIARE